MSDRKQALGPIMNLFSGSDRTLRQISEGAANLKPFQRAWVNLVSDPACNHIRPAFFLDGKLTVWVESPVWGNWIRHRRDSLITGIEKQGLPKVHTLVVRLSPEKNTYRKTPSQKKIPGEDVQKFIKQTAQTIAEPELRKSLQRLAKTLQRSR